MPIAHSAHSQMNKIPSLSREWAPYSIIIISLFRTQVVALFFFRFVFDSDVGFLSSHIFYWLRVCLCECLLSSDTCAEPTIVHTTRHYTIHVNSNSKLCARNIVVGCVFACACVQCDPNGILCSHWTCEYVWRARVRLFGSWFFCIHTTQTKIFPTRKICKSVNNVQLAIQFIISRWTEETASQSLTHSTSASSRFEYLYSKDSSVKQFYVWFISRF